MIIPNLLSLNHRRPLKKQAIQSADFKTFFSALYSLYMFGANVITPF